MWLYINSANEFGEEGRHNECRDGRWMYLPTLQRPHSGAVLLPTMRLRAELEEVGVRGLRGMQGSRVTWPLKRLSELWRSCESSRRYINSNRLFTFNTNCCRVIPIGSFLTITVAKLYNHLRLRRQDSRSISPVLFSRRTHYPVNGRCNVRRCKRWSCL